MLIFADQFAEVQWLESPPLLPLQMFQTFVVSMGGQVSIFPLIWFSETVPLGSSLQRWFPLTELPWIPPYPGLKCSGPLPTFKAPVPKLIYWQWISSSLLFLLLQYWQFFLWLSLFHMRGYRFKGTSDHNRLCKTFTTESLIMHEMAEMKIWFSLAEVSRNSPLPKWKPFYNSDLTFS